MSRTIFFKLSELFLVNYCKDYEGSTSAKNKGLWSVGRNVPLSKLKLSTFDDLFRKKITSCPEEMTDANFYEFVINTLMETRKAVREVCDANEKNLDSLGEVLDKMLVFFMYFHAITRDLGLLDKPADNEPLSVFLYHSLNYLAELCHREHNGGTPSPKITGQKRDLVTKAISDTTKRVNQLTRGDAEENDLLDAVAEKIELISAQNAGICAKDQKALDLPVFKIALLDVTITSPNTIGSSTGFLEECMNHATQALERKRQTLQNSKLPVMQ